MKRLAILVAMGTLLGNLLPVPAIAQQDLAGGIQELVSQMIAGVGRQERSRLAILDFTRLDGSVDNLGRYIAERLTAGVFVTQRFEVVERRQLDKIVRELGLNVSGLIDPAHAKQLGRLYGVDAIASGSISELAGRIEINARLMETETGRVLSAAVVRVAMDADVAALMGRVAPAAPSGPPQVASQPPPASDPKAHAVKILAESVRGHIDRYLAPPEITEDYVRVTTRSLGPSPPEDVRVYELRYADASKLYFNKSLSFGRHTDFGRYAGFCLLTNRIAGYELTPFQLEEIRKGVKPKGDICFNFHAKTSAEVDSLRQALRTLVGRGVPERDE